MAGVDVGTGPFRDDERTVIVVAERIAQSIDEALTKRFRDRYREKGHGPTGVNQFGGKGIIKFGATPDEVRAGIREEATLIDWQSPDGMPVAVTVELGILASGSATFPQGSVGGVSLGYRAQGYVLIGTPATICDPFLFDINRGRRFMVSASYVAVTAKMLSPPPNYTSGSLQVYGALGMEGSFSGSEVLYCTVWVDQLQIGETRNVATPSRAITLIDFVNPNPAQFTVNLCDTAGRVLRGVNNTSIGTLAGIPSLSADCTQIQITNNSGSVQNVELLFGLLM